MKVIVVQRPFLWLAALVLFAGCSTISPFSQTAYEQATSLKVESLAMMDKAVEPYANHKKSVDTLRLNIEKAYEYANGRPKNEITTKQWLIIKDPSRNSLGGFLRRWEGKSKLDRAYIQGAKTLVSDGFDTVIQLESGKEKAGDGQEQ